MVLRKYLQAMTDRRILAYDGERLLTVPQIRQLHRAYLNTLVVTHHLNGHPSCAEVRTAGIGAYLFSIRYYYG